MDSKKLAIAAIADVFVAIAIGCFFAGIPFTKPTLGGYGYVSSHGWAGTVAIYYSLSKFLRDPTSKSRALMTNGQRVVVLIVLLVLFWYSFIGPLHSPKHDPWQHRFLHGMFSVLAMPVPVADFAEERGFLGAGATTTLGSFAFLASAFLPYNHPIYRWHIQTVGHQMTAVCLAVAGLSLATMTARPAVACMAGCAFTYSVGLAGAVMWSIDFTKRESVHDDDVNNVLQVSFISALAFLLFAVYYLRITRFGGSECGTYSATITKEQHGTEETEPVPHDKTDLPIPEDSI